MNFNPAEFTGEHAQEIFAEVLQANNTESKGLIRSLDNIKNEEVITTIEGDIPYVAYQEDIRETDFNNFTDTVLFKDGKLTPKKIMALTFFKMNDLRFTRFAKDMAKGAANIGSTEFEKAVLAFTIPRLGKSFERQQWTGLTAATKAAIAASATASAASKAWAASYSAAAPGTGITVRGGNVLGEVDGLLAQLIAFSQYIIQVAGTQLVISNLVDEFNKVYSVIPDEVRTASDARMYTNYAVRALILQANLARQYRDAFVVEGSGAEARFFFLGMEIEFVPLPANCIIAGRGMGAGDLISGTDLTSDHQTLEINKATMVGDMMFAKQVCSLGTLVVVPGQKILYQG